MVAERKLRDNVSRVKAPSPLGRTVFVGLRLADAVWQYAALERGWVTAALGHLNSIPVDVVHQVSRTLSPYHQLLVAMSFGSGLKQAIHMAFISEQELPVPAAFGIGFFNTVLNSINILGGVWYATSQAPPNGSLSHILHNPTILIGVGSYTVGILLELVSELQRRAFKKNPSNRGKPYGGGLFSWATNINYGGYILWRAGFALASAGWTWGIFTFTFFFYDFASRGVPVLDEYCAKRVCCYSRFT